MNRKPICLLVLAPICLGFAACSDSNDSDGDGVQAMARVDALTAQTALDELTGNVDATVTGFGSAEPSAATPNQATLNLRCNAGGEAMVGGHVNVIPAPVQVDVKVAIQYEACANNAGTAITGTIDFSQSVVAGSAPLRVETLYQGDVSLSGNVNAQCAIELNVLVDALGQVIEVGGTFCGHDASTLDLHISPRWGA